MTPGEAAQFIVSDCRDPELKALADREMDDRFAEAMRDPAFRAEWVANIRAFTDEIDRRIVEEILKGLPE